MSLLNRNHRATERVDAEHTESDELSERVRQVIGAYEVGTTLDARRNLYRKTAGAQPPSKNIVPLDAGYVGDASAHLAD